MMDMLPLLMLLATETAGGAATSDQIGTWVLAAAAVGGLGLLAKQIFWPSRPRDNEYLTKGEFADFKRDLEKQFADFKKDILARLDSIDKTGSAGLNDFKRDMAIRLDKTESQASEFRKEILDYQRESTHRLNESQQHILLKMERLITLEDARTTDRQHGRMLSRHRREEEADQLRGESEGGGNSNR